VFTKTLATLFWSFLDNNKIITIITIVLFFLFLGGHESIYQHWTLQNKPDFCHGLFWLGKVTNQASVATEGRTCA
jgi:hypothetical protein